MTEKPMDMIFFVEMEWEVQGERTIAFSFLRLPLGTPMDFESFKQASGLADSVTLHSVREATANEYVAWGCGFRAGATLGDNITKNETGENE